MSDNKIRVTLDLGFGDYREAEKGWTIWQRGDSDERKRDVWQQHKQTGLSDTLTALIQLTGPPEAVAIRRLK